VADRIAGLALGHPRLESALSHPKIGPRLVRGSVGRRPAMAHLQAVAETFVATAAEARTSFFTSMREMNLTEGLPSIEVPVTVVVGSHDRLLPPRYSKRIASLIPNSQLVVLDEAGHMLPWEAPEKLVELLVAATDAEQVRRSA
ncbi:MAG: alpha/beta fold hydrolase, partial [Acidimicrobiia bacterium]